MARLEDNQDVLRLAAKYVWWTPPATVASEGLARLIANVMELGTWEDACDLLEIAGVDAFVAVLNAPPAGVISDKSLAFWHYRLGFEGEPPKSQRRFN